MKVINYVHIKNMFTHTDRKIEFTEGKNYIVGSIGTGKTLITESIAFALFGSVALRGKAASYKQTEVELSFNYNDCMFLIKRRINDVILLMKQEGTDWEEIANSTTIVNQKIISLLGYNYDIYLLSNYCKQKKLSYFSELTPSKRLQYIDKISGIEDSEELLGWLTSKRKILKSNSTVLKSMVLKPDLPKDLDLNEDYSLKAQQLTERLNSLNDLYSEYTFYKGKIVNINPPVYPDISVYATLSEQEFNQCINYVESIANIDTEIYNIEKQLNELIKLPRVYSNSNIEDIKKLIDSHALSSVQNISDSFQISCPHCLQQLALKDALDEPESLPVGFNIKDAYTALEYFKLDCAATERNLRRQISILEKQLETIYEELPYKELQETTRKSLEKERATGLALLDDYQTKVNSYEVSLKANQVFESKLAELQSQIDEYFKQQSSLLSDKDEYIKKAAEKDLYLERLELYNVSISKYNEIQTELDVINKVLKHIPSVVAQIKSETIPAISHASSRFLNLISNGVMTKIDITEDYSLIVDGVDIALKSGGQQDLASLAFRLSLGQSVIKGMFPLFIGDEIDSAGTGEVSSDISNALSNMSNIGYQVILITHSDISNIENANIIQL